MVAAFLLILALAWATYTDFKEQIILDTVHVVLIIYVFIDLFTGTGALFPTVQEAVLGFVIGGSLMYVFYFFGGAGFGDVKLMAALGTWFGFLIVDVFLVAFIAALPIAFVYILKNKTTKMKVPFGPAISIAAIIVWITKLSVLMKYII